MRRLHYFNPVLNKDVCALLLDRGADLTAAANQGMTALHAAATGGHKD